MVAGADHIAGLQQPDAHLLTRHDHPPASTGRGPSYTCKTPACHRRVTSTAVEILPNRPVTPVGTRGPGWLMMAAVLDEARLHKGPGRAHGDRNSEARPGCRRPPGWCFQQRGAC
jgi:hypothetical protein